MVYASSDAKFGLAFNKLGLIPDCGLNYFLPQLVGPYKAKEENLSGSIILAEEVKEHHVVNDIISKENLMSIVMDAQTILQQTEDQKEVVNAF